MILEPVKTSTITGFGIVGTIDMLKETAVEPEQEYGRGVVDLGELKFVGHDEDDGA